MSEVKQIVITHVENGYISTIDEKVFTSRTLKDMLHVMRTQAFKEEIPVGDSITLTIERGKGTPIQLP